MGKKTKEQLYMTIADVQWPIRKLDTTWIAMQASALESKASRQRPHPAKADQERYGKDCERCEKVMQSAQEAGSRLMTVMYKALLLLVEPDHRDDLIDFLDDTPLEQGTLLEAIGEAIGTVAGEAEMVDAPEGKAPETE